MKVEANLDGIAAAAGVMEGIISAMEEAEFNREFNATVADSTKNKFGQHADAIHATGRLNGVYESSSNEESYYNMPTTNQRLFRLARKSGKKSAEVTYHFLPSTQPVSQPDAERYGYIPTGRLRRQIFRTKAATLETQASITIAPKYGRALFIPGSFNGRKYTFTTNPVTITNPHQGEFTNLWMHWWGHFAEQHVAEIAEKTNVTVAKTGQRLMRHAAGTVINGRKVGGRFKTAEDFKRVSLKWKNRTEQQVMSAAERDFRGWENENDEIQMNGGY